MYTIRTLNDVAAAGLARLTPNLFRVDSETETPDGVLVRSADMWIYALRKW